jgi:hypothetical protein
MISQMSTNLDSITRFLNSPPGVVTAGSVLAGVVWKFFDRVEGVLADKTRQDIAAWLGAFSPSRSFSPWPRTFASVFDRVFGVRHFTWHCFLRSSFMSLTTAALAWFLAFAAFGAVHGYVVSEVLDISYYYGGGLRVFTVDGIISILASFLILHVVPDYISLLKTRHLLRHMVSSNAKTLGIVSVLILDAALSLAITAAPMWFAYNRLVEYKWGQTRARLQADDDGRFQRDVDEMRHWNGRPALMEAAASYFEKRRSGNLVETWRAWVRLAYVSGGRDLLYVIVPPAFFGSFWLWLYAGSGALLRAAQRLELGFRWFNRKFNIAEKPLQAIGLVSGACLALFYWAVVSIVYVFRVV